MRKGPRSALALALTLGAAGCASRPARLGPIGDASARLTPLGAPPRASLALAPPVDARPPLERRGRAAPRASGAFRDGPAEGFEVAAEGQGRDAARELDASLRATLERARVAKAPGPAGPPDFTLTVRLEHLYVLRQLPPRGGGAAPPGRAEGGLVYGNAGLRATLVEGRAPGGREVFREYVPGAAVVREGEPGAAERARRAALRRALARLASRLGQALDRLGRGPSAYRGPARDAAPAVFLVERVDRTRELLETLYVDAAAAAVVRHEVTPLPDPSYGRPGEWLLARRTVEGLWLPEGPYQALASALAGAYDLRALDDAERYHFFGPREALAEPKSAPAEPKGAHATPERATETPAAGRPKGAPEAPPKSRPARPGGARKAMPSKARPEKANGAAPPKGRRPARQPRARP